MEEQEGQGELLLLLFSDVSREHRSAFINLYSWTVFKITDQILSLASRGLALRRGLAGHFGVGHDRGV